METRLKEVIYSSHPTTRNPIKVFGQVRKELKEAIQLGYRLASRNITAQYRQSALGLFWAVLPPLLNSLVWIILQSQQVIQFDSLSVPYPAFVLIGTLLWQLFSKSITLVLNSAQSNKSLLSKINFPREALIFSAIFEILFNAAISLCIIFVALLGFGIPLGWHTLLSLLGVISIIVFGVMLGLLLFPISMLYRDIQLGLPILLQFAMYLTPVIYPTPNYNGWGKLLAYNPVIPLLETTRNWLLGISTQSPYYSFILIISISLVLMLIGIVLYRLSMNIIIERIGS